MCHERWLRTFGRYPSLRRQTPTGLAHNGPGGISFYGTRFYQFWPIYSLLSFTISSRWSPVRLPSKTEASHMQCVDLPGVLFVLHETALFPLCPVPTALFQATWVYFSRPRWVPESPCDVTSFAPLPFSSSTTIRIDDAVTLPKAHVAASCRTYVTFWQCTLLKEFHAFFVVWKQELYEYYDMIYLLTAIALSANDWRLLRCARKILPGRWVCF
jgi:hypothetical protein